MKRAAAISAASALCLLWAVGCASTGTPDVKKAAVVAPPKLDAEPDANSDLATITKNFPGNLDGEIRRAQLLRSKGDYDEALRAVGQLMLFAPDDPRVVGEYGKVLAQEGRAREAIEFLKRAAELQPHDWSLRSAEGVVYDQLDDHANARVAYDRALALKPGDPSVLNNYAVSRMLAGDYVQARRLFAQAQAQGLSNPKLARNLDKLAALQPPPPETHVVETPAAVAAPKPIVPTPVAVAAVRTSSARAKAASIQPVMTHPLAPVRATPVVTATNAPHPLIVASAKPPAVVMERVPVDPLAGPVGKHDTSHKLAGATPHEAKKTPQAAPAPTLRTASDAD